MLEKLDNEIEKLKEEKARLIFEEKQNNEKIELLGELIKLLELKRNTYVCNILVIRGNIRSHKEVLNRRIKNKVFNTIYKFKEPEPERSIMRLTSLLEDYEVSCELLEDSIETKKEKKAHLLDRNFEIADRINSIDSQLDSKSKIYVKKGDK